MQLQQKCADKALQLLRKIETTVDTLHVKVSANVPTCLWLVYDTITWCCKGLNSITSC